MIPIVNMTMIITKITTVIKNAGRGTELELQVAVGQISLLKTSIRNVIELSWKTEDETIRL